MHALRFAFVVTVLIVAAEPVAADMGFPGMKRANTTTYRVEVAVDLPDHVILVHRSGPTFDGPGESYFADLTQTRWVEFVGQRRELVILQIIPKAFAAKYPTAAELSKAIKYDTPGVVGHEFGFRDLVPQWAGDDLVVTYRIERGPSGDGFAFIQTSWGPGWQCWAVGCGAPVAFVVGGLWLAWWGFRRRRARRAK